MAKIRANGEGNIRKRTANTWEASLRTEDGKRRYTYGKTKGEVRERLAEIQNDVFNDTLVDENDMTVEEWMNTWIDCYNAKVKQSTKARYKQDVRCHIIPGLGSVKLQELKTLRIQRFLNLCQEEKGLAEKSLKNIYLVLDKAMTRAQKDGLIKKNPCTDAEIPAYETPQKEMRPLKDSEVPAFLKAIQGDDYEYLFFVALFTGMRESEIIGLTWDEIDWENDSIHLQHQLVKTKGKDGKYVFTTLKNKQSRTFTIAPSVAVILRKVKTQQADWKLKYGQIFRNKDNLVFTNELGKNVCCPTIYAHFKKAVKEIGLPEIRFHDLRHTYATLSLQNGADIKTVSNNLGHSTVAFTMDKYAHVTITMQKDSAQKMEAFIQSL